jgi:hypothetical protein
VAETAADFDPCSNSAEQAEQRDMSNPEAIEMVRVSPRDFVAYLAKWPFVTSVSQLMPTKNKGGRYAQTGYFPVAEIHGTALVPDMGNMLGAIRKAPTKSDGVRETLYFINVNARPEDRASIHFPA